MRCVADTEAHQKSECYADYSGRGVEESGLGWGEAEVFDECRGICGDHTAGDRLLNCDVTISTIDQKNQWGTSLTRTTISVKSQS